MAIAFIAADVRNATTSDAINTTGADLLVAFGVCFSADPSVSDSKGNSWTSLSSYIPSTTRRVRFFYSLAPASVGSGHTVTMTGGFAGACGLIAFSGVGTYGGASAGGTNSGASTTYTPGSVTPSTDGSVIIVAAGGEAFQDPIGSIDSSYVDAASQGGGGTYNPGIAYLIQSTAAAVNPTITLSDGTVQTWAQQIWFTPAGGGGGGSILRQMMLQHHYIRPRKDYWRQNDSGIYLRTAA